MDVTACIPVHHQQYELAGRLSTIRSKDVQDVFLTPSVWSCRVPSHPKQYGWAGCTPFSLRAVKCRTFPHPVSLVTEWKRKQMPKPIRYRHKGNGMLRYWTGTAMSDAEMPMLVASALMPMPSYCMIAIRWLNAVGQKIAPNLDTRRKARVSPK